ncbi:MAG TPA: tail fiber protein [Pyrinomonadaceae bacterium]|jgi:microcystin-dependent protein
MGEPYVGEIRMFAGNFAPAGWMFCDGQLLPISENETLFQLIGTTYGGDGQETFALPNLQSRVPIHQGQGGGLSNYILGEQGGVESVTLTVNQLPIHTHGAGCSDAAGGGANANPANGIWHSTDVVQYANPVTSGPPTGVMKNTAISPTGGSQPHDNMLPFECINYIISLFGVFPRAS